MATPIRVNALTTTVVSIRSYASASVMVFTVYNPSAAVAYVQMFDAVVPGNVTLGTTLPTWVIAVPTLSTVSFPIPGGAQFTLGIQVAATTTATGSSAPSVALDLAVVIG